MKRLLLFLTCVLTLFGIGRAEDHSINISKDNVDAVSSGYDIKTTKSDFNGFQYKIVFSSSTATSTKGEFQMNKDDSDTKGARGALISNQIPDGYKLKSIKINFSGTPQSFDVYLSNTPYSGTTRVDFLNSKINGDKQEVGITNSDEYIINGDYRYFVIKATATCVISSFDITYTKNNEKIDPAVPTLSFKDEISIAKGATVDFPTISVTNSSTTLNVESASIDDTSDSTTGIQLIGIGTSNPQIKGVEAGDYIVNFKTEETAEYFSAEDSFYVTVTEDTTEPDPIDPPITGGDELSYIIEFKTASSNSGGTSISTTSSPENILFSGSEYVDKFTEVSNATDAGIGGARIGTNSANGKLSFDLSEKGQVIPSKIICLISGNNNVNMSINGQSYSASKLNADMSNYVECSLPINGEILKSFTIEKTGNNIGYIRSITVYYKDTSKPEGPVDYKAPFANQIYTIELGKDFVIPVGDSYPEEMIFAENGDESFITITDEYPFTITTNNKVGEVTVDATWDADDNFTAGDASFTVKVIDPNALGDIIGKIGDTTIIAGETYTVNKGTTLSFSAKNATNFELIASNYDYTFSDEQSAEGNELNWTPNQIGENIEVIIEASNENSDPKELVFYLNIIKKQFNPEFKSISPLYPQGSAEIELIYEGEKPEVKYTITEGEEFISLSATTITALKPGKAVITASWGDEMWENGTKTIPVTVIEKPIIPEIGSEFEPVNSVDALEEDGYYVIAYDYNGITYSATPSTDNISAVQAVKSNSRIIADEKTLILQLKKDNENWKWLVVNEGSYKDMYINIPSSTSTYLNLTPTSTTVEFDGDNVHIKGGRYLMGYPAKPDFRAYNTLNQSGGVVPNLYKFVYVNPDLIPANLQFSQSEVSATIGQPFTSPELTFDTDAEITYSSKYDDIASVDPSSGEITLRSQGTTIISADSKENDEYASGHAEYTLIVIDPEAPTYLLVTNIDQLQDETECIIVSRGTAMSTTQNPNYRGKIDVEVNNNMIQPSSDVAVINVERTQDKYALYVTNGNDIGYLYAAGGNNNNNYLRTKETVSTATIEIDEDFNAKITFDGDAKSNILQYNASSSIYSCYTGTQQAIQLYRRVHPVTLKWNFVPDESLEFVDGETHETTYSLNEESHIYQLVMYDARGNEIEIEGTELESLVESKVEGTLFDTPEEDTELGDSYIHEQSSNKVVINYAGTYNLIATFPGSTVYAPATAAITAEVAPIEVTVADLGSLQTTNPTAFAWNPEGTTFENFISYTAEDKDEVMKAISVSVTPDESVDQTPKPDEWSKDCGMPDYIWAQMDEILSYNGGETNPLVDGYYVAPTNSWTDESAAEDLTVKFGVSGTYNISLSSTDGSIVFKQDDNSSATNEQTVSIYPNILNIFSLGQVGDDPYVATFNINGMPWSYGEDENSLELIYAIFGDGETSTAAGLKNAQLFTPGLYLADLYWKSSVVEDPSVSTEEADNDESVLRVKRNVNSPSLEDYTKYDAEDLTTRPDLSKLATNGEPNKGASYTMSIVAVKNGVSSPVSDSGVSEITFSITPGNAENMPTGVEAIGAEDGEVRYFTPQGLQVKNPQPGEIYIVVKGGKASKVLF